MPRRLALAALASLLACAPSARIRFVQRAATPVTAKVAAVYPFGYRWEEPPWRSHEKTMDVVLALEEHGRFLVLGPGEFAVSRAEADDPRAGSDLVNRLAELGLPVTGFVAFRPWAERRIAASSKALEGRGVVGNSRDVTYVVHLEVLDGRGAGPILELEGLVEADPGSSDPSDPAPELTAALKRLVRLALEDLDRTRKVPPLPPLPVEVRWLPAATLAWAPAGQPSLAEKLRTVDAVEADLLKLSVYRYFDRDAGSAELARELRLPGGLRVDRVKGPWRDTLREGDVILEVNDLPALGPHVLRRAVAGARGGAIELRIARGKMRIPVTVMGP